MISRREFMTATAATSLLLAGSELKISRAAAAAAISADELLKFEQLGNISLIHVTDIHAQLVPILYREPAINIGVGENRGKVPHITGAEFREKFNIPAKSSQAYAFTYEDFAELATTYGRMGGLDRIATVIKSIRQERGEKVLLLDGGDTWTNSWTSLKTAGQDMVEAMNLLKPDVMTGHWEFTLGADRVKQITSELSFPFLAQNIRDSEFEDVVFDGSRMFERNGVRIGVIGQAYPFTPIANPRWMFANWTFGLRLDELQKSVDDLRQKGADVVVLLSHSGFDLDCAMAKRITGLNVVLSGHTHDAIPEATHVGDTLIIASGSNGKFVSRLDLDVKDKRVRGYRYRLIPIFADALPPDPEMAALIAKHRAPFENELSRVVAHTESLLYRRGNFEGSFDTLICDAILSERDAEIALSPGTRWGTTVLPNGGITFEDVTNATAISYPNCYRMKMTGARLKEIFEDVADNIFNPDPFYQQGGDMVRAGGLSYTLDIAKPAGQRISNMTLIRSGQPLDAAREYVVAGWASVNQDVEGPPIWDVVCDHLKGKKNIKIEAAGAVKAIGI